MNISAVIAFLSTGIVTLNSFLPAPTTPQFQHNSNENQPAGNGAYKSKEMA